MKRNALATSYLAALFDLIIIPKYFVVMLQK
jgi:hypothetical protein